MCRSHHQQSVGSPTIICNMKHFHVNADLDTRWLKPKREKNLHIPLHSDSSVDNAESAEWRKWPKYSFQLLHFRVERDAGSDILTIVHAHFHMEGVTDYAPCEVTALPGPPCGLMANATLKYTPETYRCSLVLQFSDSPPASLLRSRHICTPSPAKLFYALGVHAEWLTLWSSRVRVHYHAQQCSSRLILILPSFLFLSSECNSWVCQIFASFSLLTWLVQAFSSSYFGLVLSPFVILRHFWSVFCSLLYIVATQL